jgi:hypothetical protein
MSFHAENLTRVAEQSSRNLGAVSILDPGQISDKRTLHKFPFRILAKRSSRETKTYSLYTRSGVGVYDSLCFISKSKGRVYN